MSQNPQPMLRLTSDVPPDETPKVTPHLLPCRIHHDGSVEPADSFWEPKACADGTCTAYFRGRKLEGKTVKLPDGYRGVVAVSSPDEEQHRRAEEVDDVEVIDVDNLMPQSSMQVQAEFSEVVVWSHETAIDASAHPHMRAIQEWLALAKKIHTYPTPDAKHK
ncbi:hypothetical protein N656DRAFT_771822 [Canariomyces notabilis]|uniref:Uncharacterized protein n=1 Tax=Canariomyces notabilis TaxID=2074819 RepID=A0AAN6T951_9PEZI|nr:hypothetical protein N656DRAFT_771822 [Canariomyces arenarius]